MIGDRETDVLCGKLAGCRTVRISENGAAEEVTSADFSSASLREAADLILL
jgi:phosphoglycolate phosphatase-like HAD superfamily hydrolase